MPGSNLDPIKLMVVVFLAGLGATAIILFWNLQAAPILESTLQPKKVA